LEKKEQDAKKKNEPLVLAPKEDQVPPPTPLLESQSVEVTETLNGVHVVAEKEQKKPEQPPPE
jgi:hypothetical protein